MHTPAQIERTAKALDGKQVELVPLDGNPIDAVWSDRPPTPQGAVALYPPRLAGLSAAAKIARVRKEMAGADALLVSDPHALCWTFNLRGADVAYTPIALGFALLPKEGRPRLYFDAAKLTAKTRALARALRRCGAGRAPRRGSRRGGAARRDGDVRLGHRAGAARRSLPRGRRAPALGDDPIALLKAVKNATELEGARAAHLRDGVALTRFLAWFAGAAPKGRLTEISAAQALETFRDETGELRDLSFPTISAFGPHAAIPHYRVTRGERSARSAAASISSIPARNISTAPPM